MIYMRLLELFSGTGSVGKVAKDKGWEVVSLDLKGADINTDILKWDYTEYEVGYFDVIWASPPCDTFSRLRQTWIGRKLKCHNGNTCTTELLQNDIDTIGLPILRKAEEIINYFKPKHYFIENPQTGKMKDYIDKPYYDVDYCKYADWGYQKRTRIWTNLKGFEPKLCKKDCGQILHGKHKLSLGDGKQIKGEDRHTLKQSLNKTIYITKNEKYRIPPNLIRELFNLI